MLNTKALTKHFLYLTSDSIKPLSTLRFFLGLLICIALVGCGGGGNNDDEQDQNSPENVAPLSDAGDDQAVTLGSLVLLNGSASSDADGDTLTYQWSIVSQPNTANASFANPQEASTTFSSNVAGDFVLQLYVSDGELYDTDNITVSINDPINQAPTIQSFSLTHDASSSSSQVTFLWQISDPDGDVITCLIDADNDGVDDYSINNCSSSSSQMHNFSASGTYTSRLHIIDEQGGSDEHFINNTIEMNIDNELTKLIGPVTLGLQATPDIGENILVNGNYAYLADTASGVQIFDVSNPRNPRIIAFVDTEFRALDVALSSDAQTLFIGDQDGLYSVDVSTPASPIILQNIRGDEFGGRHIYLENEHLYVAAYERLIVMDISDPSSMILSGSYDLGGMLAVNDLHVVDGVVYMANDGLKILDASTPNNIQLLGSMYMQAERLFIDNNRAYIAAGRDGVIIVNIENPASLSEITRFEASNQLVRQREADTLFVENNLIYLGAGGTLQVWDIQDLDDPVLLGETAGNVSSNGITVANQLAYVAGVGGLEIFDVSDPTGLSEQDTFIRQADSISIEAINEQSLVFGMGQLFDVFDPSDTAYVYLPSFSLSTYEGSYLYGINGSTLSIIDYSNPNNPVTISDSILPTINAYPSNLYYNYVKYSNQRLLASYANGHAHLIDVSNPLATVAEHIDLAQFGYGHIVGIRGNIVFATTAESELALIDITDRNNAIELSRIDLDAERMIVDGDTIFVTTVFGFHIIDIQDPSKPVVLKSIDTNRTNRMQKQGNFIFLGIGQSGSGSAMVFDVSIPAFPAYTFYSSGDRTIQSISTNNNTLIIQGYDSAATRVYDFSAYKD